MNKVKNLPKELQEMLIDYHERGENQYTSENWIELNKIHVEKLLNLGYDKFKLTIAGHYFTWLLERVIPQPDYFKNKLSRNEILRIKKMLLSLTPSPYRNPEFDLTTLLLWQYAKNKGLEKELVQLSEPAEGSPPAISFEGKLISQDLVNSLLEWNLIHKHVSSDSLSNILEIGAGYGRSAYIWLKLDKINKYVIVDVPPALYISQRYLSRQFPNKEVFRYRNFKSFAQIKDDYNKADLVFLMPWQMQMLPKKSFDLIYAVDSLSEMNTDLITFYFKLIDKLGKGYFYMRYCKINEIGTVKKDNYPIRPTWKSIFIDSQCEVQTEHLESLFKLTY